MRKLPVGVQNFEKIITNDYAYVDKTALVYRLTQESSQCFL
ncbi:MAG: AAA family ATPase, partial [Gracilibacteraceae bacterium]|nr:AAA family ATPase [Gracilibacteraceae bacterium]